MCTIDKHYGGICPSAGDRDKWDIWKGYTQAEFGPKRCGIHALPYRHCSACCVHIPEKDERTLWQKLRDALCLY